jgi:type IV pilus assembly protein PilA
LEAKMDNLAKMPSIGQDLDRRWLWAARLAILACLLLMLFLLPPAAWNILAVLPWMLPYLLLLAGIQSRRWREAALVWAKVIGALGMVCWLGVFYSAHTGVDGGLGWGSIESIFSGLLAATNLLLFISARKAVRKRTVRVQVMRLAAQLVVVCAFIVAGFVVMPFPHEPSRASVYEASAVSSLRTINAAQVTYASTYYKGYARTLAALGPPPEGSEPSENAADLIVAVLATGPKNGYRFIFIPGPLDQEGRAASYHVIARPIEYGRTSVRSFYTDESCVIRATNENRLPTAQDPPL